VFEATAWLRSSVLLVLRCCLAFRGTLSKLLAGRDVADVPPVQGLVISSHIAGRLARQEVGLFTTELATGDNVKVIMPKRSDSGARRS